MTTDTITYETEDSSSDAPQAQAHLFRVFHCDDLTSTSWRHSLADVDHVSIERSRTYTHRREPRERLLSIGLSDRHVSSAHARLHRDGATFVLEDLSSKNGSFVEGRRRSHRPLADGDVLRFGHSIFLFRNAIPTRPSAPLDTEMASHAASLTTLIPSLADEFVRFSEVARTHASVLLSGDTGTGKEIAARAVHALSGRKGAFVAVNCGALAPSLLESEFFGHRKGSFTGAVLDQPGLFRTAHEGTLFLDEVAELPPTGQAALLRALQEREIRPVGSSSAVKIDVRVIAATHQDLHARVAAGSFREDLLARLGHFSLRMPSLRERREDMGCIIATLWHRHDWLSRTRAMTPEAAERLLGHAWSRNIRELEALLLHAATMARGDVISIEHFPAQRDLATAHVVPGDAAKTSPRRVADPRLREDLEEALRSHQGNVVRVAERLHTSRTQIHRWIQRFGIDLRAFRGTP